MINIQILDDFENQINTNSILTATNVVIKELDIPDSTIVTIVIDTDDNIRKLNKEFLGIDKPTDVLSFTSNEIDPETGNNYLGDIIIALPTAKAQAHLCGHTLVDEIQLLIVHGFLHLSGYDHRTSNDKKTMWKIQRRLLAQIGLQNLDT